MDLSGRPRYADFESRLEETFSVVDEEGSSAGSWRLVRCSRLKKPPLEILAEHDCFALAFDAGGRQWPQSSYCFTAKDGFEVRLVASPGPRNRMQVTIN